MCAVASVFPIYSASKVASHVNAFHDNNFKRYIPTLSDDFSDNRVIVTLRREYSSVNGEIDFQNFETLNIVMANDVQFLDYRGNYTQ